MPPKANEVEGGWIHLPPFYVPRPFKPISRSYKAPMLRMPKPPITSILRVMLRPFSLRSRLIVAGLAATGVVVAHALAYFVVDPHPHSRMELLLSTGHESFGVVVAAALGALAAGLVRFGSQCGSSNHSRNGGVWVYKRTALRLSILQLVGFTALEAAERQLAGLSPVGILAEPAVLIGLITQIILALLGAALLVLLAKACERLFSRRGLPHARAGSLLLEPHLDSVVRRFKTATGSGSLRGPPAGL